MWAQRSTSTVPASSAVRARTNASSVNAVPYSYASIAVDSLDGAKK